MHATRPRRALLITLLCVAGAAAGTVLSQVGAAATLCHFRWGRHRTVPPDDGAAVVEAEEQAGPMPFQTAEVSPDLI